MNSQINTEISCPILSNSTKQSSIQYIVRTTNNFHIRKSTKCHSSRRTLPASNNNIKLRGCEQN